MATLPSRPPRRTDDVLHAVRRRARRRETLHDLLALGVLLLCAAWVWRG